MPTSTAGGGIRPRAKSAAKPKSAKGRVNKQKSTSGGHGGLGNDAYEIIEQLVVDKYKQFQIGNQNGFKGLDDDYRLQILQAVMSENLKQLRTIISNKIVGKLKGDFGKEFGAWLKDNVNSKIFYNSNTKSLYFQDDKHVYLWGSGSWNKKYFF
jgi:hypothetical protein